MPSCARSGTTNASTNDTTISLSPFPCPQKPRRATISVVFNRTGSGGPSPSRFLISNLFAHVFWDRGMGTGEWRCRWSWALLMVMRNAACKGRPRSWPPPCPAAPDQEQPTRPPTTRPFPCPHSLVHKSPAALPPRPSSIAPVREAPRPPGF